MVVSNTYSVVNGFGVIPTGTTFLTKPSDEQVMRDLRRIMIPNTVTEIAFDSFYYSRNLEEIIVEDGNPVYDSRGGCNAIIETESNTLLYGCKNTTIPDTIEVIEKWAFWGTDIEEIYIPSSVTGIECGAFCNCRRLKEVVFSEGLQWIGAWAFQGCPFTEIKLPESLEEFSNEVFILCENLEKLHIPKNVEIIDSYLISGCNNLKEITVDPDNKVFDSRGGCNAVIETKTNTLIAACSNSFIPDGVKSIRRGAFAGLDGLKWLIIPKSVNRIQDCGFHGNENLESLAFMGPVKTLAKTAFKGCASIKMLLLSDSTNDIFKAFEDCLLSEIIIPKGSAEHFKANVVPAALQGLIKEDDINLALLGMVYCHLPLEPDVDRTLICKD